MIKFTVDQQKAIDLSGTNLLVSAAAGSGKTAVLVERILKKVIEQNYNIDQFLVVTFTNLAAKEMKEKIVKEIHNKLENCDNSLKTHLEKQLELINFAKINTVHSCCFDLIREFFSTLNILPDFKIISGSDEIIIKKSIVEDVIADLFANNSTDDMNFVNFITALGKENIEDEILNLYNFLISYSKPKHILEKSKEFYGKILNTTDETKLFDLLYNSEIKKYTRDLLLRSLELAQINLKFIERCPFVVQYNHENISDDVNLINNLLENLDQNGYIYTYKYFENNTFSRLVGKGKSEKDAFVYEKMSNSRKKYVDLVKNQAFSYQPITIDEAIEQANLQISNLSFLTKIIDDFSIRFEQYKKQKNVLCFSDAEHKMIELLSNDDICQEISSRFTEIMVDEYQDTNEIQDTMFAKLAKNDANRFMVGDLKQSIYKFRFADPSIFTDKLDTFSSDNSSNLARKISLNNNFRSKSDVISSVNEIFNKIMTRENGGVDYNSNEQKLVFSANYYDTDTKKSEFILIDTDKINEKSDEKINSYEIEGKVIANRISELISNKTQILDKNSGEYRNIMYKDIVILLRSISSKAYFYKKAISNCGINIEYENDASTVFNTPEVLSLVTFLRVLDNRKNKKNLIALLKSEMFSFTNNEILQINTLTNGEFLYSFLALAESVKTGEFSLVPMSFKLKCQNVVSILQEFEEFSRFNSIYLTTWKIISQFDILTKFALKSFGEVRYKNIMMFLDFTKSLEEGMSVYEFIHFCDEIDPKNTKLTQVSDAEGAVQIMSIHKSKGLEFPVVFVASIASKFSDMDKKTAIVKNSYIGISTKHICQNALVKYDPISREIINLKNERENISEEMRVLYVALTRAKEKLILVGNIPKLVDKSGQSSRISSWINDSLQVNSYIDWIAPTVLKSKSASVFQHLSDDILPNISMENVIFDCKYVSSIDDLEVSFSNENYSKQEIYEFDIQTKIDVPSKVTATSIDNLKKIMSGKTSDNCNVTFYKKPKFISDDNVTPVQKGTAHHTVMQFIDFDRCNSSAEIEEELIRLHKNLFISEKERKCIDIDKLNLFFQSELGKAIRKSKIYREFNFSVLVNSVELLDTDSDDKILFQGIIDCLFFENDVVNIVDFKTDNVITDDDVKKATLHHKSQLDLYEKAVFEVFNLPVGKKYLYFFSNGAIEQV